MVFIVRVRSPSGMQRIVLASNDVTWKAFKQEIEDVCKVPIAEQTISKQPNPSSSNIYQPSDTQTLQQLGIQNGDIFYLAQPSQATHSTPTTLPGVIPATTPHIPPHKLTKDCNHGPRGACPYCLGVKPGETDKTPVRCQHGTGVTCIHCSARIKAAPTESATWLCNHPETAFCPKCIPPSTGEDTQTNQCSCDRSKGQECLKCIIKPPAVKIDKIPFSRFLADKTALCKFKHNANVKCAYCAPPTFPTFAAKTNCDRGHAPYPKAVCLSCAPPNANLRVQSYRHCDSISVESALLAPFYSAWARGDTNKERCAMLFGRYVPEPAETNNPGAIRAQVHCVYEPPQEGYKGGVKLNRDEREKAVHVVAQRMALECVGWVVCVPQRPNEDKYGGKVLMSGDEIVQAARFQARYAGPDGYSRFTSLLLEQGTQIEPVAFQVSDVAVGLQKEAVFDMSPIVANQSNQRDPFLLRTKPPVKHELQPTIIYKDRPLSPGEAFIPDELLVKVIVSAPKNKISLFKHAEFTSNGGELMIKTYMQQFANEDYETRLSDFNLLINLIPVIGESLTLSICEAIRDGKKLPSSVREQLDTALLTKNLL